MTSFRIKNKSIITFAIVVLSYIIRLSYACYYPVQWRDAYKYQWIINEWESLKRFPSIDSFGNLNHIPPLPLYIFKCTSEIFNRPVFVSGVSLQIVIGVLTIYYLLKTLNILKVNGIIALLLCLVVGTNRMFLDCSTQMTRDNFFLFMCSYILYFYFKNMNMNKYVQSVAIGCLIAIASLCRYESLELLVYYPLLEALTKKRNASHYVITSFVSTSTFVLCLISISSMFPDGYNYLKVIFNRISSYANVY